MENNVNNNNEYEDESDYSYDYDEIEQIREYRRNAEYYEDPTWSESETSLETANDTEVS